MRMQRFVLAALTLWATAATAAGQQFRREIEPGSRIEQLRFEHAYGPGAPAAADLDIPELRGRVVILEYWATW